MPTPIRLGYRRSGGLAGIDMTAEVSSQDLTIPCDQLVATLLDSPQAQQEFDSAAVPDGFHHELTLTDGTRSRTYRWQDPHVPETVRPLLRALGQQARIS